MQKTAATMPIQNLPQAEIKPIYLDAMVQVPRRLSVKSFAEQFYDGKINGVYKLIFNAEKTGYSLPHEATGQYYLDDV